MIAELLILRPEMPRSLLACYAQITRHLELLAEAYGGARRMPPPRGRDPRPAALRAHRQHHPVGLHEFLTDIVDDGIALGRHVGEFYLLGTEPAGAAPARVAAQ